MPGTVTIDVSLRNGLHSPENTHVWCVWGSATSMVLSPVIDIKDVMKAQPDSTPAHPFPSEDSHPKEPDLCFVLERFPRPDDKPGKDSEFSRTVLTLNGKELFTSMSKVGARRIFLCDDTDIQRPTLDEVMSISGNSLDAMADARGVIMRLRSGKLVRVHGRRTEYLESVWQPPRPKI